ncbi:MAG: DNA N-6-adenine-methyltransferase [Promethearchaeota archaeon]
MINQGLFSSQKLDWETPNNFFRELNKEFNFTLDCCATSENAKVSKFFSPKDDGLKQSWAGERVFMNPPYGREIKKWVKKAFEEKERAELIVGLLPARFHDYIYHKAKIRFIRGRLKFGNGKGSAPFPSMIVIWKKH